MPRLPRVQYPGAIYHVATQGNRNCTIYDDVDDREAHLRAIANTVAQEGWICHAYCLMTTHFHLLVETPEPNLDHGMHRLNTAHARWYNRRHGHSGHLFKRRYTAVLVVRQAHLLELARYIVLNPVRARICRHPRQWPWSSYGATAGIEKAPVFLDTDWLPLLFSSDVEDGRRRFVRFVENGLGTGARHQPDPRAARHQPDPRAA